MFKVIYGWGLRRTETSRLDIADWGRNPAAPEFDAARSLSSSQVYRLVAERPERLSLKILMALLDILDCAMDDLIDPVAQAGTAGARKKKAAGAEASVGDLRLRRARIHGAVQS
jgi:DNA-binding Xre family transcriptional regulator